MVRLKDIGDREAIKVAIKETYNSICYLNTSAYVNDEESSAIEMGIWTFMHNLIYKPVNLPLAPELDEESLINELKVELSAIITHQIVILVNQYRNILVLNDLEQGVNHSLSGANPMRKSENTKINIGGLVRTADAISFNNFDIIDKQQKALKQTYSILKEIYTEIRQLIFNQL